MIIIIFNLFIMIHDHNKNYHQHWSDDKINVAKIKLKAMRV
jgi:hypothetical protein